MFATVTSLEVNAIGEDAGRIWTYLKENGGEATAAATKKALDFKGDTWAFAIGWLAREGSIDLRKKGTSTRIFLV